MFARSLATLVCLLSFGPCSGFAEPIPAANRELVVFLKTEPGQPRQPLKGMKQEADALMAESGYTISWRDLGDSNRDAGDASVAVIELHGICQAPQSGLAVKDLAPGASLASTAVADGKVLPYSWLDCDNLASLLAPVLLSDAPDKRSALYGRAMGRLVAHELFHALVQTREHDGGGIAKRSFSAQDVLGEHFEFEAASLEKLRDSASNALGAPGELEAAGR